jgi:hypothetical protein
MSLQKDIIQNFLETYIPLLSKTEYIIDHERKSGELMQYLIDIGFEVKYEHLIYAHKNSAIRIYRILAVEYKKKLKVSSHIGD